MWVEDALSSKVVRFFFLSRLFDWQTGDPDQYEVSVLAEQSLGELQSAVVLREFWGQNDANLIWYNPNIYVELD